MGDGPEPEEGDAGELSELELSAVGEASNQMMAAAAGAIGVVLGQEIEISPPTRSVLDAPRERHRLYGISSHATSTTFLDRRRVLPADPARAERVRGAHGARPGRARGEMLERPDPVAGDALGRRRGGKRGAGDAASGVKVRVWAELGRTHMRPRPRARASRSAPWSSSTAPADAPVDLYVNGVRFAQGHLIVTDDGEWAFSAKRSVAAPAPRRRALWRPRRSTSKNPKQSPRRATAETINEPEEVAAETPAEAAETPEVGGSGAPRRPPRLTPNPERRRSCST